MIYSISILVGINLLIIFFKAFSDVRLLVVKYFRIVKFKILKYKRETSLNQIVSEEAIKEALSDENFLKKPKKVAVRIEL